MSRALTVPAFLDENGIQLWQTFIASREAFQSLRREFGAIKPAMRQSSRPGTIPDPAITARYQALREAVTEAEEALRAAERAYHAHRRLLLSRQCGRSGAAYRARLLTSNQTTLSS